MDKKTRNDISPDHLRAIVTSRPNKAIPASELFQLCGMNIDEFYKQLAIEMRPGGLRHSADKEILELDGDAA